MKHIADLFCGAGGETSGIVKALDGEAVDLAVVNHWDLAIETHRHNHPQARAFLQDLQDLKPHDVFEPRQRVDLLWASPECTHHSQARGGRPCSDQSRASPMLILKWLSDLYVKRVILENVPEFESWGPLGADGRPMKRYKGKTFEAFIGMVRSLGYKVEWQNLCAANYGDPTTRTRFFLQAVRGPGRIEWPTQSHAERPDLFAAKPWVPARDIIDWSLPGRSIFDRAKPLAPATLERIKAGIARYWGEWAEPFIMAIDNRTRTDACATSIEETLRTVVVKERFALVQPFMVPFYGERLGQDPRTHRVEQPIPTIPGSNKFAVVEPFILHQMSPGRSWPVGEPLPTVTTRSAHQVVQPFLVKYNGTADARPIRIPLDAITTKDRFALVDGQIRGLDITLRMLQPHELAAAMGFGPLYWFAGNKQQQVKQIGNAVPVNTAAALARAALEAA